MWRPVDTLWEFSFFPPQESQVLNSGHWAWWQAFLLVQGHFFFFETAIQLSFNSNDAPIETFSLFLTRCYIHSFELLLWLEIFPSTFFPTRFGYTELKLF